MIYFDNNATTTVAPEVLEAMLPFFREEYGNPSSPHGLARRPAMAVAAARESVARLVGAARPDQIVFTSGGTESNAAAIWGGLVPGTERNEVVMSAVEHASVWAWRERLAAAGFRVRVVPVQRDGALDLEALGAVLSERTALVSVMLANNETGILYPVKKIAEMAHRVGARMHTDLAQAVGKIPVNVTALGVDYATGCGHKYHASKGIGFLYILSREGFVSSMAGGEQEYGLRPGTESVPLVAGLGRASALAEAWLAGRGETGLAAMRDAFEVWLAGAIPGAEVLGRSQPRLPNTSLVWIPGVETEPLLAALDMEGVACSSGSACASGAHEPSHVVRAMGWSVERAAVVRVSASRYTTERDYDRLRAALTAVLSRWRR